MLSERRTTLWTVSPVNRRADREKQPLIFFVGLQLTTFVRKFIRIYCTAAFKSHIHFFEAYDFIPPPYINNGHNQ